jgi:hypothetical protein
MQQSAYGMFLSKWGKTLKGVYDPYWQLREARQKKCTKFLYACESTGPIHRSGLNSSSLEKPTDRGTADMQPLQQGSVILLAKKPLRFWMSYIRPSG